MLLTADSGAVTPPRGGEVSGGAVPARGAISPDNKAPRPRVLRQMMTRIDAQPLVRCASGSGLHVRRKTVCPSRVLGGSPTLCGSTRVARSASRSSPQEDEPWRSSIARLLLGLDVANLRHAIAENGRDGEVRFFGEIGSDTELARRMVAKLTKRHAKIHFCYEDGPTGYGLHRQLKLGYQCSVVAPSLIPRRPGDRVKTNRRDALQLARLLRAGELTAVWVPDEAHETIRDLVRSRETAVDDLRRKRQMISSMMLRQGRVYPWQEDLGPPLHTTAARAEL